ncbi:hypothetical protein JIN84_07640 [Luteolibacter yonseiensis]|uniref:Uncharacterized protein n=1 Tax=Luteolibacter yonseiensis TaxID=1144680 RepID=A0A934VB21_9BACT|nr:hypothetical protein [Luteolibacter yonseiensis]MBK1815481.1 hypothetical protein [Luteolibacter yonseiensis]
MKWSPQWLLLPVALGAGYLTGRQGQPPQPGPATEESRPRDTRAAIRSPRNDPFGGQGFSLSSMEDLHELFRRQGRSVASARVTLAVNSLSSAEIPALVEMIQKEAKENPNRYDSDSYMLMGALFERWTAVDPTAALAFVDSCKSRSFQKNAAGSCFAALGKVDPDRAMSEFEKLPKGEIRETAGMALVSALSDKDPAAACDLLEKEASPGAFGDYYTAEIFSSWAKKDPLAAAKRLESMPPDRVGDYSAGQLAASWAQKDPAAALKWAKTLTGDRKSNSASEVYKVIARDDPAKAWEQLKGEPGHLRGRIFGSILEIVADEDPKKAMSMLTTLGSKSDLRIGTDNFLNSLSWNDTRLAFEVIDQVKDPATRRENLGNQMYNAAWSSPELLKEQIGKLTDREKIDTSGAVLRGLVSSDPAAAEKYFLELPEAQRSTQTLSQMLAQYSNTNAKKAFEFATSLTNPQEQAAAVRGLFQNWSREDPEAAAEGWKKLPSGQGRLEALDNVAGSWSQSDPEAAKSWADSLTGVEKARALAAVLPALARDNPETASRQLAAIIASPPDGMGQNLASSAGNLAGQWADDDPAAASRWAASLPNGPSRDEGLQAVSRAWSQYDAVAAAQWLGTLEAGSSRDAAIQPLVNQVRNTDPDTAFSWAASISDENQRINELRQTLKSWRRSDLQAARATFDAANLSEKERESLAKELE